MQESIGSSIHDIYLYTDASCKNLDASDGGYIAYHCGQKIISGSLHLHNFAVAVDAEISAITEGIEATIRNCPIHFAKNLIFSSDSKTAVNIFDGLIPLTSQAQALKILQLQKNWLSRIRLSHVAQGMIFGEWVPGHLNNLGNDEAYRQAKLGSYLLYALVQSYTYAVIKEIAPKLLKKLSDNWWYKYAS